ncbi:MAG TPA: DEAD/DEAH box helicase, partial [Candidatus Limnocylindrales bacterium]
MTPDDDTEQAPEPGDAAPEGETREGEAPAGDESDAATATDVAGGSAFAILGLDGRLLQTLAALGYEEPTPIQSAAIPPLLAGSDLLAEAPTGTGKTAAFALPLLQRLAARLDSDRAAGRPVEGRGAPREGDRASRPKALVLAPTRELAMQVAEATHKYGREVGARVVPVYGGQPITAQLHRLARGVDVIVATPGRAVDHLERGSIKLDEVETVVLDEADEMLDMGFADDLERILGSLPEMHQTALFSATISGPIARLAGRHLRHPVQVRVQAGSASGDASKVRQVAYVVRRSDKLAALGR